MEHDLIIAVDPGGTTGLALWWVTEGHVTVGLQGKPFDAVEYVNAIFSVTDLREKVLLVCEKFIITQRTAQLSQQADALKICGAMEWLAHAWQSNITYEEQTAATAKKMTSDQRLKDMGLYVPGKGHANDATRHMVLACERKMPRLLDDESLFGYNGSVTITVDRNGLN